MKKYVFLCIESFVYCSVIITRNHRCLDMALGKIIPIREEDSSTIIVYIDVNSTKFGNKKNGRLHIYSSECHTYDTCKKIE